MLNAEAVSGITLLESVEEVQQWQKENIWVLNQINNEPQAVLQKKLNEHKYLIMFIALFLPGITLALTLDAGFLLIMIASVLPLRLYLNNWINEDEIMINRIRSENMKEIVQKEIDEVFTRHARPFCGLLSELCPDLELGQFKVICQKFDAAVFDAFNTGYKTGYKICKENAEEYANTVKMAAEKAMSDVKKLLTK
jgi:hypothetical protein